MTSDFASWLRERYDAIEAALESVVGKSSLQAAPAELRDAVGYAFLSGGKRVRPGLALLGCEANGGAASLAMPAAVACEMVHAYSLVHDDLPCMDDDDLRRGRPSVHKAYGQGIAVLVGDALNTLAFEVLAQQDSAELARDQALMLARAAGPLGMVGGQFLDLEAEGAPCSLESVDAIHRAKTGALFAASLLLGVRAAGGDCAGWSGYAESVGRLFQATDDLLDATRSTDDLGKTAGKDAAVDKASLVAALGVEGAQAHAQELAEQARAALAGLSISSYQDELDNLPAFLLERCR